MTLSYAENNFGFEPSKYGLTEEEAKDIAVVFSRYDQNEDGVLQTSELGNLVYVPLLDLAIWYWECVRRELGTELDSDELEAAMKLLDTDSSGVIEFEEFVDWWVNKVRNAASLEEWSFICN